MKTKIYLAIFLTLAIITAYTLFQANAKSSTEKEKAFKVENFEKVTKIIISDKSGKEMTFSKEGEQWILNNKYPVREHLFEEMEEALTKMEAGSPVPEIGKNVVIQQMVAEALKVEVYKGKKKDKVIYIGGPNLQNTASHMFLEIDGEVADRIYNVSIPGFRGYLTTRFTVNEKEWRSKKIFSYAPQDIEEISIKYFKYSNYEDFTLSNKNNSFTLKIEDKEYTGENLNEQNIANYLKSLNNQQVMAYSFVEPQQNYLKDSLMQVNKFAELHIVDKTGKQRNINVINMPLNESSKQQYDDNGDPMPYDIDYRFIEFGENKDWGVISNDRFGLLFISPYLLLKNNIKP